MIEIPLTLKLLADGVQIFNQLFRRVCMYSMGMFYVFCCFGVINDNNNFSGWLRSNLLYRFITIPQMLHKC